MFKTRNCLLGVMPGQKLKLPVSLRHLGDCCMHGSSFYRKNKDMRLLSYILSLNSHGFCECMHALDKFLVKFNHNTCNYNNNNNKNSI